MVFFVSDRSNGRHLPSFVSYGYGSRGRDQSSCTLPRIVKSPPSPVNPPGITWAAARCLDRPVRLGVADDSDTAHWDSMKQYCHTRPLTVPLSSDAENRKRAQASTTLLLVFDGANRVGTRVRPAPSFVSAKLIIFACSTISMHRSLPGQSARAFSDELMIPPGTPFVCRNLKFRRNFTGKWAA